MKISREKLTSEAQATGFRPEVLEKVIHLLNLLEGFNSHPFLKGRWALKGGTALNLFLFDVPRLSVDIDLNYVGAVDSETMMAERPKIEQALLARQASRDLFDAHQLLTKSSLDREKLRLGFVLYGGMNRKDWRTVKVEDVGYDPRELENQLLPIVRPEFLAEKKSGDWAERMIAECRRGLEVVLPMNANEIAFLDSLLDHGRIEPERLTADPAMTDRIKSHPLPQLRHRFRRTMPSPRGRVLDGQEMPAPALAADQALLLGRKRRVRHSLRHQCLLPWSSSESRSRGRGPDARASTPLSDRQPGSPMATAEGLAYSLRAC